MGKGTWEVDEKGLYGCYDLQWGMINRKGEEIVPFRYTEISRIDNTDDYLLCEKYENDAFLLCIYDIAAAREVIDLDFEFDNHYMFNNCHWEGDCIIFDEHIPGEEKNYISAYSLREDKWLKVQELEEGNTLNGETKIAVEKDGEEIIIF